MEETMTVTHAPPGRHTLTPRIVVRDAGGLIHFLRRAFNVTGEVQNDRPSEIEIGDSVIMISDAGPREVMPAFLYVYVDDVDATYRRALEAGATSVEEPLDLPYGDRRGMVRDAWGNLWQIATHQTESP
jgi:PhnB protein